jgi:hypothetical protein
MTKAEFTQRTKYTPNDLEYRYIEESYYDFDGDKDEFCKAWLKDKKNGKWELEMRLRWKIDKQKKDFEAQLTDKEERLDYYTTAFNVLVNKLKEYGEKPYAMVWEALEAAK